MKPENKAFLESTYHHWVTLRDAQYLKGLNGNEREGMQRVMREEFIPGYVCDLWCPACCAEMVKQLYTRYDAWKAANPEPVEEETAAPIVEGIQLTTGGDQAPPVMTPLTEGDSTETVEGVEATFPKDEKPEETAHEEGEEAQTATPPAEELPTKTEQPSEKQPANPPKQKHHRR